jgi:hypothetical protein
VAVHKQALQRNHTKLVTSSSSLLRRLPCSCDSEQAGLHFTFTQLVTSLLLLLLLLLWWCAGPSS